MAPGATQDETLVRLVAHFRKHTPKSQLADCLTCGGVADVQLAVCPYCGDGSEEEGAPLARAPAAPVVSERTLDVAVARIQALKSDSAGSLWELGSEIKSLYDSSLWKQRTDEKGAPRWRSWGQFCEAELGVGAPYAYKLMDVAQVYSRDQVRSIGATKLHITLQVPKEHRERLLAGAVEGKTVTELRGAAAALGKVKRDTGRTGKGGAGSHKPGAKKGGRPKEHVTVAMLVGRAEIPLFRGLSDKPARSVTDVPRGTERLLNGVAQVFVLSKDEAGNLILIVERVRE